MRYSHECVIAGLALSSFFFVPVMDYQPAGFTYAPWWIEYVLIVPAVTSFLYWICKKYPRAWNRSRHLKLWLRWRFFVLPLLVEPHPYVPEYIASGLPELARSNENQ